MPSEHHRTLLLAISCLLFLRCLAISRNSLGINPQDEAYYGSSAIKCRDGSRTFSKDQLNDDFCDCPDGTDEPGTSACPEGKFYCRNVGHMPRVIFSSRVNDGICDCCDGSDEYHGKTNCSNTCWEAGKAAREKLKKKISTYQEGVTIRVREIKRAHGAFIKDEAELSKLKTEEKSLEARVQKLRAHKERIEQVEEQERLRKEKEEKQKTEIGQEESKVESQSEEPPSGNFEERGEHEDYTVRDNGENREGSSLTEIEDQNYFGNEDDNAHWSSPSHVRVDQVDVEEKNAEVVGNTDLSTDSTSEKEHDAEAVSANGGYGSHNADKQDDRDSINSEVLSKEELGRVVASRWTGESVADIDPPSELQEHKDNSEFPEGAEEEDYDGYNSDVGDDHYNHADNDANDYKESYSESTHGKDFTPDHGYDPESEDVAISRDFNMSSSHSWLSRVRQSLRNVFQAVNLFIHPVNISEAAQVRKDYDDASSKLSKVQSRISTLTEKLKHDYGNEKEFYSFFDQCFENKENKYTYKICPYKEASQIEGYSTTRLGNWDKFEESYKVMKFTHGERCWNGPDRSLEVRLRCGLTNELTDVDEPSRCEYTAVLSTPIVCTEPKLKELREKLSNMNSDQALARDEL